MRPAPRRYTGTWTATTLRWSIYTNPYSHAHALLWHLSSTLPWGEGLQWPQMADVIMGNESESGSHVIPDSALCQMKWAEAYLEIVFRGALEERVVLQPCSPLQEHAEKITVCPLSFSASHCVSWKQGYPHKTFKLNEGSLRAFSLNNTICLCYAICISIHSNNTIHWRYI